MGLKLFSKSKVLRYEELRSTGSPTRQVRDFSDPAGHVADHKAAGYEQAGQGSKPADGTLHMYSDQQFAYREQDGQVWRKPKTGGGA